MAVNPHTLLDEPKEIQINGVVGESFNAFKKLMKEHSRELNVEDAFMVGYFLGSNDVLRRKYLDKYKEPFRDERIQDIRFH